MIVAFRHKGLEAYFERGDVSKLKQVHIPRIRRILARLDAATSLKDMNMPGYNLHKLKSDLLGYFAVTVSGNYRIIFRFEEGEVYDVDYIDYH